MKNLKLITLSILLSLFTATTVFSSKYFSRNAIISFFSTTPLEDIKAETKSSSVIIDTDKAQVAFKIVMKSFHFKKAAMQKHFNQSYIESKKYPNASFLGTIKDFEKLDFSTGKPLPVSVTGTLSIHGVTKKVTINGMLSKTENQFNINAKFPVTVADYNIKIPGNLTKNIAGVVEVTVKAENIKPFK